MNLSYVSFFVRTFLAAFSYLEEAKTKTKASSLIVF